jgi:hypothetical protein
VALHVWQRQHLHTANTTGNVPSAVSLMFVKIPLPSQQLLMPQCRSASLLNAPPCACQ